MVDYGNYVVVEGDIVLKKSDLLGGLRTDTVRSKRPAAPNKQWVADTLVSQQAVVHINVDLSAISSNSDWADAIRGAMANWNAIPGTWVSFYEGAPGDVTVTFASLQPTNVVAQTAFPTGSPGKAGPSLQINTNFNGTLNASQKLLVMTHELGHALGFRHTNWQGYQCGFQYYTESQTDHGAHQVYGTPGTDNPSVMNGCNAGNYWAGFSHYDSVAALYAYGAVTLTESNQGGHPLVTYSYAQNGIVSASFHLQKETWGYDENWNWVLFNSFDQEDFALGSPFLDTEHPWAYESCYMTSSPSYEDDMYWELDLVYPQETRNIRIPAHVLDETGDPRMACY
jgi:hypothetical protein